MLCCITIPATTFCTVPSPPMANILLYPFFVALFTRSISSPLLIVRLRLYFIFSSFSFFTALSTRFFAFPELENPFAIINHSLDIFGWFYMKQSGKFYRNVKKYNFRIPVSFDIGKPFLNFFIKI